ncbi:hypothetical protein [Streptomyces echinatus]|uniref:hypothetical protein n=1 Tax=Streptomyces echinatus TaxID=67293 RepID=UPI0031E8E0AC
MVRPRHHRRHLDGAAHRRQGTPTIGGRLPQTRVYVLDSAMRPYRPAADGELCRGRRRGVARGYLAVTGLDRHTLRRDPFGTPGARCTAPGNPGAPDRDGETLESWDGWTGR